MRYAVIDNGKVVNIVVSDYPLYDSWVEADDVPAVTIGWSFDPEFGFSAPVVYTLSDLTILVNGSPVAPFAGSYYCNVGDTVTMTANITSDGVVVDEITVPVVLKMPIIKHANGKPTDAEAYLNVTLNSGVITATGVIETSGDWKILIARNNEALKRIGAQWSISAAGITFLA